MADLALVERTGERRAHFLQPLQSLGASLGEVKQERLLDEVGHLLSEQLHGPDPGQRRPPPVVGIVQKERRDHPPVAPSQRDDQQVGGAPAGLVARTEPTRDPVGELRDHPWIAAVEIVRSADPEPFEFRHAATPDIRRRQSTEQLALLVRLEPGGDERPRLLVRIAQHEHDAAESDPPNGRREHAQAGVEGWRPFDLEERLVQQHQVVALPDETGDRVRLIRRQPVQQRGQVGAVRRIVAQLDQGRLSQVASRPGVEGEINVKIVDSRDNDGSGADCYAAGARGPARRVRSARAP